MLIISFFAKILILFDAANKRIQNKLTSFASKKH
jgi:hypothetical protein